MSEALYGDWLAVLLNKQRRTARLSALHHQVVEMVCGAQAPPTVSAIANAIGRHQSQTSRMVQELVDAGLVQRAEHPSDRRLTLVSPTPKARALDEQVRAWMHDDQPAA
jgi:DNA-binding MarR family transcriptional regulator